MKRTFQRHRMVLIYLQLHLHILLLLPFYLLAE